MAKPFRFNLQRVLDIRIQLEERAKMELGKATAAFHGPVCGQKPGGQRRGQPLRSPDRVLHWRGRAAVGVGDVYGNKRHPG